MLKLPRSMQGRLLLLVLGTVLLVWTGTAAVTWIDARHELDELLDAHLTQTAALLVAQQTHELAEHDTTSIEAPTMHHYTPRVAFQVFHHGRLALRSGNAPAWRSAGSGETFTRGFSTISVGGSAWRVFATQGAEGDMQVYVGELLSSRTAILWAVLRSTLWPMLLALPLLALAAWWSVARGMRPLRRLGQTLAQRPAQALQPVQVDDAPQEMKLMIVALNGMFARIATLLDTERRFTADAAHELRTPIAAIRAQAQVALAETDDALRQRALRQTLEGCDRATRLVEQLLTLARVDTDAAAGSEPLDLAVIARRVAAEIAPAAIAKQQSFELEDGERCLVDGDQTLLEVLVRNLVDNAVRYSPPSAQVQVRVARDNRAVVLSIEDSGAGLSAQDAQRLGDRFFRVPGNDEAGSGLGWSIVRRIAAVHRGHLSVERSAALGGLAVRVAFPGAAAAAA